MGTSFNVAVVGGGIIGCSIAWKLVEAGASVTIYDAGTLGGEASTAGAGMLAPGGEIRENSAFAKHLVRALELYPAFVRDLHRASGVSIDYRRCGAVEYLSSDADVDDLKRRQPLQQALGIRCERVSPNEYHFPGDAVVDPNDVMRALRITLQRSNNVTIREHEQVSSVEGVLGHLKVDGKEFSAAVIAAGAWSSRVLVERFELPWSYPVKGHLIGYDLPPGSIPQIVRRGHTYVLQRANGFAVAGSSQEKTYDKSVSEAVVADIRRRAEELVPQLRGRKPSRVWTGLRPAAQNPAIGRLPLFASGQAFYQPDPVSTGEHDSAVWLAYGHFRNGILAAPATAEQISREIVTALSGASSEKD